jgi:hypothetical protein
LTSIINGVSLNIMNRLFLYRPADKDGLHQVYQNYRFSRFSDSIEENIGKPVHLADALAIIEWLYSLKESGHFIGS